MFKELENEKDNPGFSLVVTLYYYTGFFSNFYFQHDYMHNYLKKSIFKVKLIDYILYFRDLVILFSPVNIKIRFIMYIAKKFNLNMVRNHSRVILLSCTSSL